MENILVNIGAETKDFLAGLSEVGDSAGTLDDKLKALGVEAGIAFAGFTAAIMETVHAYGQQEEVSNRINAILYATGGAAGVTAGQVTELADSFEKTTNFSKLQVEQADLVLLRFSRIGSEVFPEATHATLEIAAAMGTDATTAARMLGMGLDNPTTGLTKLKKAGVDFTDQQKAQIAAMVEAGNVAGAQKIILDQVAQSLGNQAEAAHGGVSGMVGLKNAMEALSVSIGEQFAPYIVSAANGLQSLIEWANQNKALVDLAAGFLAAGAAITGTVTAIIAAKFAIGQLGSAISVAKIVVEAFGLSAKVAMGATGVGLILIVALEIYQHWATIWPAAQEIFHAFVSNVGSAAGGLAKILKGAFTLDLGLIKEGLAQTVDAFKNGYREIAAIKQTEQAGPPLPTPEDKANDAQIARNKASALLRLEAQKQADIAVGKSKKASMLAEELAETGHTAAVVNLAKERAKILATLADQNFTGDRSALQKHLADVQSDYDKAYANETKQTTTFNKLTAGSKATFTAQEHAKIVASIKTDQDAKHQNSIDDLNFQIQANNTFLQEEDRYGTAYAEIHKFMRSKEMQGAQSAFGEMAQFTQSSNSTLQAIGKTSSAVNIMIKGIESAQNIYAGFSTIPIIGPALGIAGAAAAMAFAAENEAKVLGLAEGGLVTGGIPGMDSVPAMLQQGELITPARSFDEVVNSVAASRNGQTGQKIQLEISFKGNASRWLQVQTVQDKSLGTYRGS